MIRHVSSAAAVAALLAFAAAPASGATRLVDDNGTTCPAATFTSIQAAVDASATNDVVIVCTGTYAEQVDVPESKPGLQLKARGVARVVQPAGGLVNSFDGNFTPRGVLIALRGDRQLLRGFRIEGRLDADCSREIATAVLVDRGSTKTAVVDSNRLAGIESNCTDAEAIGIDMLGSDPRVDRNDIRGTFTAIRVRSLGGNVMRNTIFGGTDASVRGIGIDANANDARVHVNTVSSMSRGILLHDSGRTKIYSNTVTLNTFGIELRDDTNDFELRGNRATQNGAGLVFTGLGFADTRVGLVRNNTVRNSGGDGIFVGAPDRPFDAGFIRFLNNRSTGNGATDCRDDTDGPNTAGTENVWSGNVGNTDSPDGLCKPAT